MKENSACVIITSIASSDNIILGEYARLCPEKNIGLIIAGDAKSPADFNLPGCEYLSLATQKTLPFTIAGLLPDHNYAKKNIAYLQAIQKGHTVLIETDDDNIPLAEFWEPRSATIDGDLVTEAAWVNVYKYFSDKHIWPRGFSLNHLKNPVPVADENDATSVFCPIQQGLVDENPDVDAIYRLSQPLPVFFKKRKPIILAENSICPFNSQNTTWFKPAFPLLYLPSFCTFRMTDIWRSFIAQRILSTCSWNIAFHQATAFQKRNAHYLLKDFEEEISGYLNNEKMVIDLSELELKAGEGNMTENLRSCYKMLIDKKYIDECELTLVDAWINDLGKIW